MNASHRDIIIYFYGGPSSELRRRRRAFFSFLRCPVLRFTGRVYPGAVAAGATFGPHWRARVRRSAAWARALDGVDAYGGQEDQEAGECRHDGIPEDRSLISRI